MSPVTRREKRTPDKRTPRPANVLPHSTFMPPDCKCPAQLNLFASAWAPLLAYIGPQCKTSLPSISPCLTAVPSLTVAIIEGKLTEDCPQF